MALDLRLQQKEPSSAKKIYEPGGRTAMLQTLKDVVLPFLAQREIAFCLLLNLAAD